MGYLESVMISVPNYGEQLTLNEFMPLWNIVEDFIDKKKILSAGVCDFMLPLLNELYDAAKVINHDLLFFEISISLITGFAYTVRWID